MHRTFSSITLTHSLKTKSFSAKVCKCNTWLPDSYPLPFPIPSPGYFKQLDTRIDRFKFSSTNKSWNSISPPLHTISYLPSKIIIQDDCTWHISYKTWYSRKEHITLSYSLQMLHILHTSVNN